VSVTQGCQRWAWPAGRWYWRAGWLAGDGRRGRSGRGRHTLRCQPARSGRWAVEVRVFTPHTGAGWAWWRVSVRPRLAAFELFHNYIVQLDSLRWFSHRRSRAPVDRSWKKHATRGPRPEDDPRTNCPTFSFFCLL